MHTALFLLIVNSEFINSKWKLIEKDPDVYNSSLEGLKIQMNKFQLNVSISDEDFMIHILNNLPKGYDVILKRLENQLISSCNDAPIINLIRKK